MICNRNSSPGRFSVFLKGISLNLSAYFQPHNAAYQIHQTYYGIFLLILKAHTSANSFPPPIPMQHSQTEDIP